MTEPAKGKPHGGMPPLLNRETAILEFNRRVLEQARREDVPLLERLRYVCIVSSNLDEFFEVRYADNLEASHRPDTGVSAADIETLAAAAHALVDDKYKVFNDELMPALAANGIRIVNHADRNEAERHWVGRFFETQVRPLLVPVGLDPAHPFPQVANKSLNFIARLGGKDAFGRRNTISIVKVPRVLPRVMKLPGDGGEQAFVLLTSVIRAHLGELFPGREVESFSQFRITRDSDLEVDADVSNLRQALRSGLTTRHFGQAVRLELFGGCFRKRGGVGITLEQRRRHHVHARVGGLRRQNRRYQQLVRSRVVQLRIGVGMLRFELPHDLARRAGRLHR